MTLDEVAADERTSLALERAIEILGEAAGKVPPDWRAQDLDLPWRQMTRTRHRLAHACFAAELFILDEVATVLLPPLLPHLQEMVEAPDEPQDRS